MGMVVLGPPVGADEAGLPKRMPVIGAKDGDQVGAKVLGEEATGVRKEGLALEGSKEGAAFKGAPVGEIEVGYSVVGSAVGSAEGDSEEGAFVTGSVVG